MAFRFFRKSIHSIRSSPTRFRSMSSFVPGSATRYASLFGACCDISDVIVSQSDDHEIEVDVVRSVRDVDENRRRKFTYPLRFSNISDSWKNGQPYEHSDNCSFVGYSPSGKKSIRIINMKSKNGKDPGATCIELWEGLDLISRTCSKVHDKVYPSSHGLGGLTWSKDETKIVYVAEKKSDNPISFFTTSSVSEEGKQNEKEISSTHQGEEFDLRNDWGEQLIGSDRISLFLFDPTGDAIKEIEGCTSNGTMTPSQPLFSHDGTSIIFVAYLHDPKKLGLIYCIQRPCQLHRLCLTGTTVDILTSNDRIAFSPRLNHQGNQLVYLSSLGFDTHCGPLSMKLVSLTPDGWFSNKNDNDCCHVLIDATTCLPTIDPKQLHGFSFPGYWFPIELPEKCFSFDDAHVWFTSFWGSCVSSFYCDTSSGVVHVMDPAAGLSCSNDLFIAGASVEVLATLPNSKGALLKWSTPINPGGIVLVHPSNDSDGWKWSQSPSFGHQVVTNASMNFNEDGFNLMTKDMFSWKLLSLVPPDSSTNIPIEGILITPNKSTNETNEMGLIVVPHGGPHSTTSTSFLASYLFLSKETNCAILHVNYRGSIGFGSNDLNSLPGKVGTQDVADMMLMMNHAIETELVKNGNQKFPNFNKSHIGVVGGSHGGFLGAHLIGQHSDVFKVSCLRNPVINMASMCGVSDIPDWCSIEALGIGKYDFDQFNAVPPEALKIMFEKSPIAHVDKVRAPTLIALGAKDRRVPSSQGVEYYHILKAKGITSRLLVYPEDCHPIASPSSEADHWINIANWMNLHIRS